jgi:ubiquinone/menaquinone biosynthesis C-methylase UbiE
LHVLAMSSPPFDFDAMFNEDYLYFYGPMLEAVSDADADAIWRLAGLEPGLEVLDLACGHGRIANRLTRRGARMTGLDATPLFLEHARTQAAEQGLEVEYLQGDMRALPFADASFDRVISFFTSFGYFSEPENRQVLAEVRRVLRPGGRLMLDANNLAELLPRWLPSTVIERDGDMVIDRAYFDPVTGLSTTDRTIVRDGRTRRLRYTVRMFMAVELGAWLREAGFSSVEFRGRAGEGLTAQSKRMIAIAWR